MLRLGLIQFIVAPLPVQKFLVSAELRDFPLLQDQNVVAKLTAAHAVGNVDGGFPAHQPVEILVNLRLRNGIESRGRLVDKLGAIPGKPCKYWA